MTIKDGVYPLHGRTRLIKMGIAAFSIVIKGGMQKAALIVSILFPFILIPANSFASNPFEGAKAAGMGTAFVAVADDPSAIAHNPAGLTQLNGTNIYGGMTFVIPSTTYTSPSGQSEDTEFQIFFPPHLYFSSDLGTKDMRFGVGIYSPFGIGGTKWGREGLTRYSSTESMIATLAINPTFAYQVLPSLSIGIGLNYMISRTQAKRMVDQSIFGADDGEIILKGIGDGWGYNFGLLFIPDKRLSLGFAYRSRVKVGTATIYLTRRFSGSWMRRFKRQYATHIDLYRSIVYKGWSLWLRPLYLLLDSEQAGKQFSKLRRVRQYLSIKPRFYSGT
jgi:long-subunit fatty acid transport protein